MNALRQYDNSAAPLVLPTPALVAQRALRRLYGLALLLSLATLLALPADLTLSRLSYDLHHRGPGDLHKALNAFEAFAHGGGVLVLLVAVAVLDQKRRRCTLRLAACAYGAGLLNLGLKALIGRTRPQEFWRDGFPDGVGETFVGLLPAMGRHVQSFPSGHAATAAAFAVGLAWLYPHGRWFFAALAGLAMLQRVECGAHFVSDVLAGAAVGVAFAALCVDGRRLGRWFDRHERRG